MPQTLHAIEHLVPKNGAIYTELAETVNTLTAVKLLSLLTRAVQQHRGASMGVLSGQPAFIERAEKLELAITQFFSLLKHFDAQAKWPIPNEAFNALFNEWQVIAEGWEKDQLMHNYEFHSHLIDQLLRLLRIQYQPQISEKLTRIAKNQSESVATKHWDKLATAFLEKIPQNTETLGRLRSLCTNVAVVKACGADNHSKISFLLNQAEQENNEIQSFETTISEDLSTPRGYKKQFRAFVAGIKNGILDSGSIEIDSSFMFNTSTNIIDQLWGLTEAGVQIVEKASLNLLPDSKPF